jgi:hypothetical protein
VLGHHLEADALAAEFEGLAENVVVEHLHPLEVARSRVLEYLRSLCRMKI